MRRWWLNFGEDGFIAWWRSLPSWRCRFGFHKRVIIEYRKVPDYPWIVEYAEECVRCHGWFGYVGEPSCSPTHLRCGYCDGEGFTAETGIDGESLALTCEMCGGTGAVQ